MAPQVRATWGFFFESWLDTRLPTGTALASLWSDLPARLKHTEKERDRNKTQPELQFAQSTDEMPCQSHSNVGLSNCCQSPINTAWSICKRAPRWKLRLSNQWTSKHPNSKKILLKIPTRVYIITGYIPTAYLTAQLSTKAWPEAKSRHGLKAWELRDGEHGNPQPCHDWNKRQLDQKQKPWHVFSRSVPKVGKAPEKFWLLPTIRKKNKNQKQDFFSPGIETFGNIQQWAGKKSPSTSTSLCVE